MAAQQDPGWKSASVLGQVNEARLYKEQTQEVVKDRSPLDLSLYWLEQAVSNLDQEAMALGESIAPICRPAPSSNEPKNDASPPGDSAITYRIFEITTRIGVIERRLREWRLRVEA